MYTNCLKNNICSALVGGGVGVRGFGSADHHAESSPTKDDPGPGDTWEITGNFHGLKIASALISYLKRQYSMKKVGTKGY